MLNSVERRIRKREIFRVTHDELQARARVAIPTALDRCLRDVQARHRARAEALEDERAAPALTTTHLKHILAGEIDRRRNLSAELQPETLFPRREIIVKPPSGA